MVCFRIFNQWSVFAYSINGMFSHIPGDGDIIFLATLACHACAAGVMLIFSRLVRDILSAAIKYGRHGNSVTILSPSSMAITCQANRVPLAGGASLFHTPNQVPAVGQGLVVVDVAWRWRCVGLVADMEVVVDMAVEAEVEVQTMAVEVAVEVEVESKVALASALTVCASALALALDQPLAPLRKR